MAGDFQTAALADVRADHEKYFEAIERHPRMLVGTEVPAIGREGTEMIKDTADAREWQEAVKGLLVEEIRDRASRAMEDDGGNLSTLHQSIELFQKNVDLIPGTKGFDKDLATRFAQMVKPYETRVEGKLHGYSIPVQPIIDSLRAQVKSERAAAPVAPVAGAAAPKPGARVNRPAEPPQAGIRSKAGAGGSETEDFSTLFGTIGLPNLQI